MAKLEKNIKKKFGDVEKEKKELGKKKTINEIVESTVTKDGLDVTEDMVNMFIRFEVQRRYLNMISMEVLCMQYGQKGPSCLHPMKTSNKTIPLANVVMNGRNITLDEFLEGKKGWDEMPKRG